MRSERFFQAIFNGVTDVISILDANYRIIEVNEAFLKAYGFSSPEEVVGRTCHEVTHNQASPCDICLLKTSVEKKCNTAVEHVHCCQDGDRNVEISFFPMDGEAGSELVIHIARDVTECKKSEQEHRQNALQLQKALDEIRVLKGLLPICAACKKIRDDRGHWETIEKYIGQHADVKFSHGLCPECTPKYFPPKE